jgi:hypothetical protein
MTDGAIHATIWAVDAGGHGVRLACDPIAASTVRALAVSPDALFVVVHYLPSDYWQVARIARPASP